MKELKELKSILNKDEYRIASLEKYVSHLTNAVKSVIKYKRFEIDGIKLTDKQKIEKSKGFDKVNYLISNQKFILSYGLFVESRGKGGIKKQLNQELLSESDSPVQDN